MGIDIDRRLPKRPTEMFTLGSSVLLEAVATGRPLEETARRLVELVEDHIDACMATILEADEGLRTLSLLAASHELPSDYLQMLENAPVGPFGTCARAVYDGRVVVHPVNAETEDWAPVRELIDRYGFRASWSFPLFDADGIVMGTLGLYFDHFREPSPEERQLLEHAAHLGGIAVGHRRSNVARERSERRFRNLVENIAQGVIALDPTGRAVFGSERARALTPADEIEGRTLHELLGLSARDEAALLRGESLRIEVGPRWLDLRASSADDGAVVVIHDATDERALQERLIQADRLASMGTLAAGVAHEINTPLMAITMNLGALSDAIPSESEPALWIEEAEIAASRIDTITRDLLTVARAPASAQGVSDLANVVETSLRLGRHRLSKVATVAVDLSEDLPKVDIPSVYLGQVLINLMLNAAQAFPAPEPSDNLITIVAKRRADTVELIVEDNGPGISPEVAPRIFDPFFTTKGQAEGTGLGLAIARGLIERAGGTITLDPTAKVGSRFIVTLPLVTHDVVPSKSDPAHDIQPLRVLFVDDDTALLRVVNRALMSRGHFAAMAPSGEVALGKLAQDDNYDVILLDISMPEMDGRALASAIAERHPPLNERIIFATGGVIADDDRVGQFSVGERWLRKPFNVEQLEELVRALGLTPNEGAPMGEPSSRAFDYSADHGATKS